jgi:hypothetical protein
MSGFLAVSKNATDHVHTHDWERVIDYDEAVLIDTATDTWSTAAHRRKQALTTS